MPWPVDVSEMPELAEVAKLAYGARLRLQAVARDTRPGQAGQQQPRVRARSVTTAVPTMRRSASQADLLPVNAARVGGPDGSLRATGGARGAGRGGPSRGGSSGCRTWKPGTAVPLPLLMCSFVRTGGETRAAARRGMELLGALG